MASSPIEKELLGQVLSHSDKHFGRVDAYLADMRKFLSNTPEWQPQHDVVFKEMLRSVRTSRWQGIGAAIIAGSLVIALVVYAWVIVPWRQQQLAERLRAANLAIEFEERGSDLFVKYVTDPPDPERDRLLKAAKLYNVAIGRYPGGLGTKAVLGFKRGAAENTAAAWHWDVTPQSQDSIIGTLTVDNIGGSVDLDQVFFGEAIQHTNLPEFYLKINTVNPETWVDQSSDRSGQYQVTFGVNLDGASDLVWSAPVYVRYSGRGHIEEGPFFVSAPGWPSAYVANVAIGYWGGEERRVAHYVKSDAYRISFN